MPQKGCTSPAYVSRLVLLYRIDPGMPNVEAAQGMGHNGARLQGIACRQSGRSASHCMSLHFLSRSVLSIRRRGGATS